MLRTNHSLFYFIYIFFQSRSLLIVWTVKLDINFFYFERILFFLTQNGLSKQQYLLFNNMSKQEVHTFHIINKKKN